MKKGKLIIFTAPSGAGKTTIVRHLLKVFPNELAFSVSATTRARRSHETDGVDYYFISIDDFKQRIQAQAFAEWEEVYSGQYYGTLKAEVQRLLDLGKSVLFDIDIRGAFSLKSLYGDACISIFVQPPSFDVLKERLIKRNTEDEISYRIRIKKAGIELSFADLFDHILINDRLDETLKKAELLVVSILDA
jgi:guanylate kinase